MYNIYNKRREERKRCSTGEIFGEFVSPSLTAGSIPILKAAVFVT
jgi:hypothetical protein